MRPLLATFLVLLFTAPALADPTSDLHKLFKEDWQARLERDPFLASQLGKRAYDAQVPDASAKARTEQLAQDKAFLERLTSIDKEMLSAKDKLNYDLFAFELNGRIAEAAFTPSRIPFLSDSGFHTAPVFAIEAIPFQTGMDYENYLARLAKVPDYLTQNIANMRQGIADGFTMPRAILDGVASSFKALAADTVEESAFFEPFKAFPASLTQEDQARLTKKARVVIGRSLLPAYRSLYDFFTDTYMPAARKTLGANALPQGDAYYSMLIKKFTTLDLSAEEIHQIGLREAQRIRTDMETIIAELGFDGSFADFLEFLRSDPQFYAKTPQDLLDRAAWLSKSIDEKLPAYFGRLPRMPYGVRAVPDEIAPNYTTGRYWPAIEGVRGGLYLVNTHALDKRPLYALPALTLHEAVPGHHLQISLAKEIEDVPEFRRYLYVNAFGEGWGLYSEKLGVEMGLYETPYDHFGRLSYEMWRAGRLVVDTGIHAKGWTRDQAIAFFEENSALSKHNIRTEVDRYISWPGQALGYKMGEIKIWELRKKAEDTLNDAFDLRAFHDAVLGAGALPLPLLEARIDAYIRASAAD